MLVVNATNRRWKLTELRKSLVPGAMKFNISKPKGAATSAALNKYVPAWRPPTPLCFICR
uniref:Uncharacterized protein n=1 Tax=Anopheles minimus TaxID=112268 RepID=A0A182WPB8_9DIPT